MFGCLGCVNRLSMLAILFFAVGSAVMMAAIIVSTDGLGGKDLVELPVLIEGPRGRETEQVGTARINDVVSKRKLFAAVPLPGELSTETPVIVTNVSLAIIFALLFGLLSTLLNNLVKDKEAELEAWLTYFYLDRIFYPLKAVRFLADQDVQRGCLSAPVIIFIFAAYGVIFALLEPGINLLTAPGIQLAIILAMSVGLISLAGDVAQRRVAWVWRKTSRFGVYPANLSLAVLSVAFSRLVSLSPGILFGTPGGVDVDKGDEEPRFRDAVLAITTLTVVAVFAGLGWGIVALMRDIGDQTLSGSQLEFAAPLVQLGLALGLALFVVAIETAFFEMIPLTLTMGTQIFRWNPLVWVAGFVPVVFVFAHTLLNPNGEYLEVFEQTSVVVLTVTVILLAALLGGLWLLLQFFDPPNLRRPPLSPHAGQPYQQYPQSSYPPPSHGAGYPPPQSPPQYPPPPGQPRPPHPANPPPPQRRNPPR
jgi:hypothetical protein